MKYKIIWEVSKFAEVEAENEERALEEFWAGNYTNEQEEEITLQPEVAQ